MPDQVFRSLVLQIPGLHVIDWNVAEAGARSMCAGLAEGMPWAQVVAEVQRDNPTFTPAQSAALVDASVAAYCPQYRP